MSRERELLEKAMCWMNIIGSSSSVACEICDEIEEELAKPKMDDVNTELLEALESIIARWDTPLWKDVPHTAEYINAAREVVAKAKGIL